MYVNFFLTLQMIVHMVCKLEVYQYLEVPQHFLRVSDSQTSLNASTGGYDILTMEQHKNYFLSTCIIFIWRYVIVSIFSETIFMYITRIPRKIVSHLPAPFSIIKELKIHGKNEKLIEP